MQVDTIKAIAVYITAGVVAIGSLVLGVFAWMQPPVEGRDLAILFALLGTAFGGSSAFLWNQESATRAARSTERAVGISPAPTYTVVPDAVDPNPVGVDVGVADAQ